MITPRFYFLPTNIVYIFAVIIFFICGILWHATSMPLLLPTTLIAMLTIATLTTKKNVAKNTLLVALASTAFFAGNFRYKQQIAAQEYFFKKTRGKTFDIIATVQNMQKNDGAISPFCSTLFVKKIKESRENASWEKLRKNIQIYTFKPLALQVADKVKIKQITIKEPANKKFVAYLIKQSIAATIFKKNPSCKVLHRPRYAINRWLHLKKQTILNTLKRKMPRRLFAIFSSLFLGNKSSCKKETDKVKIKFKAWGILHLLARSGLHLILFLLICEYILQWVPLYFLIKQIIMILLSILYLVLSWPSVSFIRAFSVLTAYKACPLLNIKPDLIHIVAIICFTMLLHNPIQIFFLDFQLSFLLTFTLAIFSKIQTKQKRKQKIKN